MEFIVTFDNYIIHNKKENRSLWCNRNDGNFVPSIGLLNLLYFLFIQFFEFFNTFKILFLSFSYSFTFFEYS